MSKNLYKEQAVLLRNRGYSYSEILKKIPVAKSTLSLWLRNVGLAKKQKQKLTEKKRLGQLRGAYAKKYVRLKRQTAIYESAQAEIGGVNKRELWLMGIALYWAEGAKEKEHRPGSGVMFSNSDPRMIKFFLRWLKECCELNKDQIGFDIYIHEMYRDRTEHVRKYWSQITGFSAEKFTKVYFKKHKVSTNRKNVGNLYNGLLRVTVKASSGLNRKIAGWIMGVCRI